MANLLNKVGDTLSASSDLLTSVIELLEASASWNDLKIKRFVKGRIRWVVLLKRSNFLLYETDQLLRIN